jgi:hypothetical protein
MAIDGKGAFARSTALGSFDRGEFERITPAGAIPALIVSSDYPIVVGQDGALYYVPYRQGGPRELIRKMPNGTRSIAATLPSDASDTSVQWVNGIATGPSGALYVTDNSAVRKIDAEGHVSMVKDEIQVPDCSAPVVPRVSSVPYLRGLAVAPNGTMYVAANGCRAVIEINPQGAVRTILKAESPWSPTGIALSGNDVVVLEYTHIPDDDRRLWIPRIRRISSGGKITTLATVER